MAESNKKGYSTGGSDSFDLFADLDSLANAPQKTESPKAEVPETVNVTSVSAVEPPVKQDKPVVEPKAEPTTEQKIEPMPVKKKSPIFAIICAVLCVAIVACACLSIFNISKPKHTTDQSGVEADGGNNIYTEMFAKYNTTEYPMGIQQTLVKAYASNNDLVGWLYIPGTAVNTPIVQCADNTKYLRNNFFGANTGYGTAYADFRCKRETLSSNHVIYGHNMPSGTHFYDVSRFEDIEWYKQHPVIKYSTLTGNYTYLVYAAFYTTALIKYNGGYFFNYIYPNMGPISVKGYIQQINERAIYKTGISASSSDKFITLSTCTHSLDAACKADIDGRLVVVGRLLREGESENVDTSKATANPDYRRPQIWYDRNGKTNPYAKSVTWIPSAK